MNYGDSSLQYADPSAALRSPYRTVGRTINSNGGMHPDLYSAPGTVIVPGMLLLSKQG